MARASLDACHVLSINACGSATGVTANCMHGCYEDATKCGSRILDVDLGVLVHS